MSRDGIAMKKIPNGRDFALPGIVSALGLDFLFSKLHLYVAAAKPGSVNVLSLSNSRSNPKLVLSGQVVKLQVWIILQTNVQLFHLKGHNDAKQDYQQFINVFRLICLLAGKLLLFCEVFNPLLFQEEDSVSALAVDWITSNLYWSSKERPDIHVTSASEGYTTSLLQGSLVVKRLPNVNLMTNMELLLSS